MTGISSKELADYLHLEHFGAEVMLSGLNSLSSATGDEVAFCVHPDQSYLRSSDAGVVICLPDIAEATSATTIPSENPRLDFIRAADHYFSDWPSTTQIHPEAVVSEEANVGDRCIIGPNVYVGPNVSIGSRCKIQSGTSIGGEGFGFFPDESGKLHGQIHQGVVDIGDDVEIGSNCSIDRAVFDNTSIGNGTKIDNLVHVAHNATIGEDVWIADTVAIQGSVTIGNSVRMHPNSSVADHVEVGENAEIGMNAAVLEDVPSGDTVAGIPAKSIK